MFALGLITAFAGYTAVYALNDLIDCRIDRTTAAPDRLPVRFGVRGAVGIIGGSLLMAPAMSLILIPLLPAAPGGLYLAGALFSGFFFLLLLCYHLWQTGAPGDAFGLFNRASCYPLSMLAVTILDRGF